MVVDTNHRPWRTFVSYSRKDATKVKRIATALRKINVEVWLDEWSILPGEAISAALEAGIDRSDFLLLMLSPDALKSGWVQKEWRTKYLSEVNEKETKVIVVRLAHCDIPSFLKDKLYVDFWKRQP